MGHPGKHPIDPDTGLCDVCDSYAIEDIRQGRKPQKRIFYGPDDKPLVENVMDEPFYPGSEDDAYYDDYRDQTNGYAHRRVLREPPVRRRRVIQERPEEKPFYVRRRTVPAEEYYEEELPIPPRPRRRGPMVEEVIVRRPIQPKTFYYVDQGGQRVPRLRSPPSSPPPSYIIRGAPRTVSRPVYELPPVVSPPPRRRVVQVIRRRRQTPSPVANHLNDPEPPRLRHSDSEVFDPPVQRQQQQPKLQQQRPTHELTPESPLIPQKVTMYHIEASPNDDFNQLESHSSNSSNDDRRLSARERRPYALDNRRPAKLTQNGRESPSRLAPTVIRRSYRPPPANDEQIVVSPRPNNGQMNRNVRRNLNNQPEYYPRSDNRNNPRNVQRKDPSIYYMQSSNRP